MDMTGWWFFTYPSEKYDLVSWDDDFSQWTNKIHVPKHQPEHEAYNISMVCICYTHTQVSIWETVFSIP